VSYKSINLQSINLICLFKATSASTLYTLILQDTHHVSEILEAFVNPPPAIITMSPARAGHESHSTVGDAVATATRRKENGLIIS
jgi:hypothetical protein